MGSSGGFKQGKPGKALLELKQVCTSKFPVGQLATSKRFRVYEDEKSGSSESIFLCVHGVPGAVAVGFECRRFD
jgi:hypothetical protein